jgi:hypothetical protein
VDLRRREELVPPHVTADGNIARLYRAGHRLVDAVALDRGPVVAVRREVAGREIGHRASLLRRTAMRN